LKVSPFKVDVPDETLVRIDNQVRGFPWERLRDAGGWSAGTSIASLRRLAERWTTGFNWRDAEARLNSFPQFRVDINGVGLHFIHIRGSTRRALMLIHGWPGSCLEFLDVIDPLAHPDRFGGDSADGFDLIIPSLPGFAFSDAPLAPMGPRAIAGLFNSLMTDVLGYSGYIAQGGDWGSAISGWLAHDFPAACTGIHLNMALVQRPDLEFSTDAERAYAARRARVRETESAYAHLQSTRPQTLSFAMLDNPVGIAAWILEKFAAWSDIPRSNGEPDIAAAFDDDRLLSNIMTYVLNDRFQTSTWIYKGRLDERSETFPAATFINVPTGIAAFPDPVFAMPPRSLVEQSYRIIHWTDMAKGGHFAAMEAPQAFTTDVQAFARKLAAS
jgi:pimeloyl-ACP methyl ester carboxylesterase